MKVRTNYSISIYIFKNYQITTEYNFLWVKEYVFIIKLKIQIKFHMQYVKNKWIVKYILWKINIQGVKENWLKL